MSKLVITAALVGAELTRKQTPNLPLTPEEIAIAAEDACNAGASVVHLHVRDKDGQATQDRDVFARTIQLIKSRCDAVIQVSTGGAVGMTPEERLQPVTLSPEMATLTCGTVNFGDAIFANPFPLIRRFARAMREHGVRPEVEVFDTGAIATAERLIGLGLLEPPVHFDFVMGMPGGIPATVRHLVCLVDSLPAGSTWTVAAIGRSQLPLNTVAVAMGGHVRVGFEDNVHYQRGVLADSNAQLVARVVRIATELGREIASPADARAMLRLPAARRGS
ncbi:MAG: 3-keto-5-aminohexanoate cleavage protein [Bacillota bacterium]|nr:3-keto-5-aminohexanoate cleavage protein [Bacillota bacterium]